MFRNDKKVFILGLIASSFALMTTLKAQNYSYEVQPQAYPKQTNYKQTKPVTKTAITNKDENKGLIDLSSVYSKNVSISYANNDYPTNEITTKRKIMRVASIPNHFRSGSDGENWTVRIGEESLLPLGFPQETDTQPETTTKTLDEYRVSQYGNLLMDEMLVGEEAAQATSETITPKSVVEKKEHYTFPKTTITKKNITEQTNTQPSYIQNSYHKEEQVIEAAPQAINDEQDLNPWVQSSGPKRNRYNQTNQSYSAQKQENPWSKDAQYNTPSYQSNKFNITRTVRTSTEDLQQRQQAYVLPELSHQQKEYRTFQNVNMTSNTDNPFQSSSSDAFSKKQGTNARPLLVPINDTEFNEQDNNSQISTQQQNNHISANTAMPSAPVSTHSDSGDINLTELKINFKPTKSDLSIKTVKWLKEFSKKASIDFNNIIEVNLSPKSPELQNERFLLLKGILNSNGIYDQQIRVISERRGTDSVTIKVIENGENYDNKDAVDYSDLNGSYYYYY